MRLLKKLPSSSIFWHKSIIKDYHSYRRNLVFISLSFFLGLLTLLFLVDTYKGINVNFPAYFLFFFLFFCPLFSLIVFKSDKFSVPFLLFSTLIVSCFLFLFQDIKNIYLLFGLTFPLLSISLTGTKKGLFWTFIFLIVFSFLYIFSFFGFFSLSEKNFSLSESLFSFFSILIITFFTFYTERQHEKYLSQLTNKLCFDEITNLPNKELLLRSLSSSQYSILCIIQIDNFNDLGSLFGYNLSDYILKSVSSNIQRFEDVYGYSSFHLKGQEFALLIASEKNTNETDANSILYLIWNTLQEQTIKWDNIEIRPTYRLGGAITKMGDVEAISKADMALKTAIRKKSPVTIYKNFENEKESAFNSIMKSTLLLENIKNGSFKVLYQPIVDTESHEVVWYESLIRIKNIKGEYESIFHYLPIAKSIGIYEEITKFVIVNATNMLKKIDSDISVNISLTDIIRPGFVDVVINCCKSIKDRPGKLILEIVETEELSELQSCLSFLNIVRSAGCKIAIDDFGSGYSNMTNLIDLPIDIVKIDGALIKKLPFDKKAISLVSSISNYCKSFSKKTVAEYVENHGIYDHIKNIGIDFSQGYMFGHPDELV